MNGDWSQGLTEQQHAECMAGTRCRDCHRSDGDVKAERERVLDEVERDWLNWFARARRGVEYDPRPLISKLRSEPARPT